jgi:hypothetical protein
MKTNQSKRTCTMVPNLLDICIWVWDRTDFIIPERGKESKEKSFRA